MQDPSDEAQAYVRKARQKGLSEEAIAGSLRHAGWVEEQIAELLRSVPGGEGTGSEQPTPGQGAAAKTAGMTLHDAAACGDMQAVRTLLERGAHVNAQDESGMRPLHLAGQEGHIEIAKLLLDRGADGSARDKYGQTPLNRALAVRHLGVTQLLRDLGAQE